MAVTKKVLQLTFGSASGKEIKVTINNPAVGLTGAQIGTAMTNVIAAGALGEDSLVATKVEAKYIVTDSQAVTLA